VLAKSLAMIAEEDDRGSARKGALLDEVEDATDVVVGEGYLPVVEIPLRVTEGETVVLHVFGVRIQIVYPQEEALAGAVRLGKEPERGVTQLIAVDGPIAFFLILFGGSAHIEHVKAPPQTVFFSKIPMTVDGKSVDTALLQPLLKHDVDRRVLVEVTPASVGFTRVAANDRWTDALAGIGARRSSQEAAQEAVFRQSRWVTP
jgi:hypothetical protein